MKISELIAGPPIGCAANATLVEMAGIMIDEGVGSLAVMDGSRLLGIVTDRDIVGAVAEDADRTPTAADLMTRDPDTVDAETDISNAVDWLNATGYRHLPVTTDGQLVGIISIKDLLWATTEQ